MCDKSLDLSFLPLSAQVTSIARLPPTMRSDFTVPLPMQLSDFFVWSKWQQLYWFFLKHCLCEHWEQKRSKPGAETSWRYKECTAYDMVQLYTRFQPSLVYNASPSSMQKSFIVIYKDLRRNTETPVVQLPVLPLCSPQYVLLPFASPQNKQASVPSSLL